MSRPVRLLAPLALVTVLGCPLDIDVREPDTVTDAGPWACVKDQDCPDGQRCDDASEDNHCEKGPRVTQPCGGYGTCSYGVFCDEGRCEEGCLGIPCRLGYQCAPDFECVEACTEGPPSNLGAWCKSSTECGRCGFCVALGGGEKQCHQPCTADAQCPEGAPGTCVLVAPGKSARVCRPG
ncbi:latent transforming growth factor beta-binding protein [Archangium violaceum]|uniref:latent transforming growth factor beta-binding protein n=1 Tax=Archangium violaceum TaxID=83451 RepID=UPI00193C6900|nr:latent transforming growth factor beta-binding protein [Archangium violaceum]QRK10731.1 latent transforming growth factor beta-binding protein [Archangium violaceum]